MERCEGCGFAWDEVAPATIAERVTTGVAAISEALAGAGASVGVQPAPGRWSALEYAAHTRDVLLTLRDRLVIGIVEDEPSFTPMYREERVTLALYRSDTAPAVSDELASAAAMFIRLFAAIPDDQLDRTVQYGTPTPTRRTLRWMAQQAVHEVEHHGSDITANLRPTTTP